MGPPRARPCPAPQVLRHELAELYSELKKYDQAQAELSQLLDHLEGAADKSLDDMCQEVRSLVLLARVHRERGALQDAVAALARSAMRRPTSRTSSPTATSSSATQSRRPARTARR